MYSALQSQSEKLASIAKNGTLKIDGVVYTFTFTREWVYEVSLPCGEVLTRFNTKKLTQARQWLRDYLAN